MIPQILYILLYIPYKLINVLIFKNSIKDSIRNLFIICYGYAINQIHYHSLSQKKNSLPHLFVDILCSKVGSSIGIIYLLCCDTNHLYYHARICKLLKKLVTVLVFC